MKPEIEYVYNKLKKLRFDFNSIDFREFRNRYRYEPTLDRYVRKDDNDLFIAKDTFKPLEEELEYADKCHNLEEQLGCPLEVVIKALKYGIYIKNIDGEMVNFKCELYYKNPELGWYFLIINGYVPLTDYKTKFWLKEDKSE